jgi:hypothetical protein
VRLSGIVREDVANLDPKAFRQPSFNVWPRIPEAPFDERNDARPNAGPGKEFVLRNSFLGPNFLQEVFHNLHHLIKSHFKKIIVKIKI